MKNNKPEHGAETDGPDSLSEPADVADRGHQARVRLRPLLAVGCVCVGIGVLWFIGVRIGISPNSVPHQPLAHNRLESLVTEHVQRDFNAQSRVGLVIAAIADGKETVLGYGARHLGHRSPVDENTLFEIGSITKAFTGILLARQIESGELTLDTRIAELLPRGWSLSESASQVTLEHLTTHTSGFPRLPANHLRIGSLVNSFLFGGGPYRSYSEELFREAVATSQLYFIPGTERHYSNFAVMLLGHILATRSGSDYGDLVRLQICEPLGMHDTSTSHDGADRHRVAGKYRWSARLGPVMLGLTNSEWIRPNHLQASGGIRSSGADMLKFLKANMGMVDSAIQPAIERSHQELFRESNRRATGMNWMRSRYSSLPQLVIWHNGGTSGHTSYLGFTEDGRNGVVALSNTGESVDRLGRSILTSLAEENITAP